jgi:hypothetical protein
MADKQVILTAIDGALAQCATAHAYYFDHGVDGTPIQAIYSSLTVVRMLLEDTLSSDPTEEADAADAEDEGCRHPNVEHRVLGGDNWVDVCPDCNSIVAQS